MKVDSVVVQWTVAALQQLLWLVHQCAAGWSFKYFGARPLQLWLIVSCTGIDADATTGWFSYFIFPGCQGFPRPLLWHLLSFLFSNLRYAAAATTLLAADAFFQWRIISYGNRSGHESFFEHPLLSIFARLRQLMPQVSFESQQSTSAAYVSRLEGLRSGVEVLCMAAMCATCCHCNLLFVIKCF